MCSAPGGNFGTLDPIEAFADLAWRKGLYLHVDGAFGGFILPFMRDLGYEIPPFDLSLKGVSSIMTDGHKLGLLPIATGFFLARDASLFESIPTERTLIHTTSSTKPGSRAAGAWATFRALGPRGLPALHRPRAEVARHHRGRRDGDPGHVASQPPGSSASSASPRRRSTSRTSTTRWPTTAGARATARSAASRSSASRSIPSRSEEAAHGFVKAFEDAAAKARRA